MSSVKKLLAILLCVAALVLVLVSCDNGENGGGTEGTVRTEPTESIGGEVTDEPTAPAETESVETAPAETEPSVENKISFTTLQVDGTNVYGKVSNDTTMFSFIDEITVSGSATYTVSLDVYGMQVVATKTVALSEGDNTFYVLETVGDEIELYSVVIRRRPMYTVTFDTTGGTAAEAQTVEEDGFATAPETTRTGYTLDGWSFDFATPITENALITAKWTANTYKITYDVSGGDALAEDTQSVTYDAAYTLALPTRTGYTFAGWVDKNGESFADGTWTVAADVALTATWTANTYKITYDVSGGDALAEDTQSVTYDAAYTLALPTRTGYTFAGWVDKNGKSFTDGTWTVAADVALTATWTANTYEITYDVCGGDALAKDTQSVTYDKGYTLVTPTRTGYTFAGWVDKNGKSFTDGTWTVAADVALTATWKANTYQITYDVNGGDALENATQSVTYDAAYKLALPMRMGYTFAGWVDKNGESFADGTWTVAADVALTAVWEINSYKINFVVNGGDGIGTQSLVYASKLPEAVREGYTFGGWFCDAALTREMMHVPAEDITLYAYWSEENKPCDFGWVTGADGSVTIADYYASDKSVWIPSQIGGIKVTSIGDEAFSDCDSLTSIEIPASVTSIGSGAFSGCGGLIQIENGVSYVGRWAVDCDDSVTVVSLRANTVGIGDDAFYNCSALTSIEIPASVTSIGEGAFSRCSGLTSIEIPARVVSIGKSAFSYCWKLTSIEIPASVVSIGDSAFSNCSGFTSVEIPARVVSIGKSAFSYCWRLTSVTFAEGSQLTSIGDEAFSDCDSLTSIEIPASVTSIGKDAFRDCSGLIQTENGVSYVDRWVIDSGGSVTAVKLRATTVGIGAWAFSDCSELTSIKIPAGVTSIGAYAFNGCSGLTSIVIPEGVTSIGAGAFSYCWELTSIEIPASVVSIGAYAFEYCSGLTSVTFEEGSQLTSIGSCAFYGCSGLTSIAIPDSVMSIGNSAFWYCSRLTSIEIPESVTSIGDSAFYGCGSLFSIEIPESVKEIGVCVFSGCSRLIRITVDAENPIYRASGNCLIETASKTLIAGCKNSVIPADGSVTRIGDYAFDDCWALTSIEIPDSVTSIGKFAFSHCHQLTSIVIPESVTSIGSRAFDECYGLISIVISEGVTSIGYEAFAGCRELTAVYYGGTESDWERISIDYNQNLIDAMRYYYSETSPTQSGNYWRYVDGVPTVW